MKSWWDNQQVAQIDDRLRNTIKSRATSKDFRFITLQHGVIERPSLTKALLALLNKGLSGVCVLLAPPGSGKSTYLDAALILYREKCPDSKIYCARGLDTTFFTALGLPAHGLLEDFLPPNSLIIFDQVDIRKITEQQEDFIVRMATTSRNSNGHFRVFIQLSHASVVEKILELNGRDKIYLGLPPKMYKWNETDLLNFALEVSDKSETSQSLSALVNAYAPLQRCGPLFTAIKANKHPKKPSKDEIDKSVDYWKGCDSCSCGGAFYNPDDGDYDEDNEASAVDQ